MLIISKNITNVTNWHRKSPQDPPPNLGKKIVGHPTAFLPRISESVPSHRQGIAMGVYGVFEDVGAMIGPAIGGFLWVSWGPKSPFLAAGLISVIGAILFVMAKYFSNLRLQSKIKQSQKDY